MLTTPRTPAAIASNCALGSRAYTSTCAPAALSNSAFQAAAALAPATTTLRPSSLRNTGSRASGAMRAGGGSERISDSAIEGLKRDDFSSHRHRALLLLLEHDLFRKPVPTFRDHAQ